MSLSRSRAKHSATYATREVTDVIEPSPSGLRKRKRIANISRSGSALESFTIKPCPASPYDRSHVLTPIAIISRASLPLAFLDTFGEASESGISRTRLFTTYIEALETPHAQAEKRAGPQLLISRVEGAESLYAVERVRKEVYALCRLGRWVNMGDVGALMQAGAATSGDLTETAMARQVQQESIDRPWWEGAVVANLAFPKEMNRNSVPGLRLCMEKPLNLNANEDQQPLPLQANVRSPDPMPDSTVSDIQRALTTDQPNTQMLEPPLPVEEPIPAQQVLETLVTQYLDALYTTKTSLAYFAKGPLSRARAAYSSSADQTMQIYDLAAFLRTLLLSPKMADQKWREIVPEIVTAIPLAAFSDDDLQGTQPKRKRSKKLKLSKNGMFPSEDDYLKRWWREELSTSSVGEGQELGEALLKNRLVNLRVRENFAQLIIVLEIMALEASSNYKLPENTNGNLEHTSGMNYAKKKTKRKKMQDLTLVADLLVDKLCIWQSLEGDGLLDFAARQSAKRDTSVTKPGGVLENDRLRNFCVEVIIPFYMSRLSDFASTINKKLGGPIAHSPERKRTVEAKQSSAARKRPGEAVNRAAQQKKPRQTLGRSSTDTAQPQPHYSHPLPLNRSATDPLALPRIKREESLGPSLKDIPLASVSTAAAKIKRFTQRSVDFAAMTAANEAKLKRKKDIDNELRDAIGTLKKPNRGAAVREFVEYSDHRRMSSHQNRKTSVLVTATPKKSRNGKSMIADNFDQGYPQETTPTEAMGDPVIPSSGIRPFSGQTIVPGSAIKRPFGDRMYPAVNSHADIVETPSKASSNAASFADRGMSTLKFTGSRHLETLPQTPIKAREDVKSQRTQHHIGVSVPLFATPQKPSLFRAAEEERVSTHVASRTPVTVLMPPQRPSLFRPNPMHVASTPVARSLGGTEQEEQSLGSGEMDVYKALGWDEDLDDLA